ncbi:MAG: archemetzincin [Promethearchaeota archaeon]|nr:MAG: archemetzincin [Candidatus Lokiarchaeota archaeon]
MDLGLLQFEKVDRALLEALREGLAEAFDPIFSEIFIIEKSANIPENSYSSVRGQYSASRFLQAVRRHANENHYARILGITALDLYTPRLNFVFGIAESDLQAKAAVISLHRLAPEFWGQYPDPALFPLRVIKESIHELGHTFGLPHCANHCIMRFSNSILDTDWKPATFCGACRQKISTHSHSR